MYTQREYSLVNPTFSAEAATLAPPVFKKTLTLVTKDPPKDHPDKTKILFSI